MSYYEDKLNAITSSGGWQTPGFESAQKAYSRLVLTLDSLSDHEGIEGETGRAAGQAFSKLQAKFNVLHTSVVAMQGVIESANRELMQADSDGGLPPGLPPDWVYAAARNTPEPTTPLFVPELGITVAANAVVGVAERLFGNKREEEAKRRYEAIEAKLKVRAQELRAKESGKNIDRLTPVEDVTTENGISEDYSAGDGSQSGGGTLPRGHSASYVDTSTYGRGSGSAASGVGLAGATSGSSGSGTSPSADGGYSSDGSGSAGGHYGSNAGGYYGTEGGTGPSYSADSNSQGQIPGTSGGFSGANAAMGAGMMGGGAAAGAAALKYGSGAGGIGGASGIGSVGGIGGAGSLGGSGGLNGPGGANSGSAGVRGSGGLLGSGGQGAGAGASGTGGASAASGGAGGAGGRGGMMGTGGQGGGSQSKDKRPGLGGHIAPKIEDEDEFVLRPKSAGSGGRAERLADEPTQASESN
ncbi:hypothetical protein [Demequina aurantiaca]|uniref:hypothetical protein n=1 Tax=Demequina aurantiaca TaxID=676200 RepID=UPI003D33741A